MAEPEPIQPPEHLGRYEVRRLIGRGGMGEVYLCWDPFFERAVAVKRMRPHLITQERARSRFLREAKIAGALSHPGIIAVYALEEGAWPYYVMPYVEGRSLRTVLQERDTAPSIPVFLRLFLQVCHAVAYAHSRGVLHRDLKPENIIMGRFGEMVLLDWGLARLSASTEDTEADCVQLSEESPDLTMHGKVVGTLAYMAPERALRQPATIQTEIYALGVTLYWMLCLRPPFKRKSYAAFRKNLHKERFRDPMKIAPEREVPAQLVRIVRRCLHPLPSRRYATLEELIHDVSLVLEGRSDWFASAEIHVHHKGDWEFQEHIHLAPLSGWGPQGLSEWVGLMISRASFPGNIRLELQARIKQGGRGIGFLLSVPEAGERQAPDDGYLLWLHGEPATGIQLYRRHALVMDLKEALLTPDHWHQITIEKVDNAIRCWVDHRQVLSYISHLPLHGSHVGILHRDGEFDLSVIRVLTGNTSATVSCLTLPDAFLSYGDLGRALSEYRRIAYSFPERSEGREARFRAGLTLLEQARHAEHPAQRQTLESEARQEFELLRDTAGAPLEYLGKALIAQQRREQKEEVQYIELGLRRFRAHPLCAILEEQVSHRLMESAYQGRAASLRFLSLITRILPSWTERPHIAELLTHARHAIPTPWILEGAPDTLLFDYALVASARIAASPPSLYRSAAQLLLGQPLKEDEQDPSTVSSSELKLLPLLAQAEAPSPEAWADALQGVAEPLPWVELLCLRGVHVGWDLDLYALLAGPSARAETRIVELCARSALAFGKMEWYAECLACPAMAKSSPSTRALLEEGASWRLHQQGIHHPRISGLGLLPEELARATIGGYLSRDSWSRALPIAQREALVWLRLLATCAHLPKRRACIDHLLATEGWYHPPPDPSA